MSERSGKSVFLAKSFGCFEDLGTAVLVPAFALFLDGERLLACGIGLEIRKKVSRQAPLRHRHVRHKMYET